MSAKNVVNNSFTVLVAVFLSVLTLSFLFNIFAVFEDVQEFDTIQESELFVEMEDDFWTEYEHIAEQENIDPSTDGITFEETTDSAYIEYHFPRNEWEYSDHYELIEGVTEIDGFDPDIHNGYLEIGSIEDPENHINIPFDVVDEEGNIYFGEDEDFEVTDGDEFYISFTLERDEGEEQNYLIESTNALFEYYEEVEEDPSGYERFLNTLGPLILIFGSILGLLLIVVSGIKRD